MPATYKQKLRGWLIYAFASEAFVVVSLTLFLPICLEQFARDNGFLQPERTESCSSLPGVSRANVDGRCAVKIGWLWIDTASFSLYVYSMSVALQALTVISMGSIADRSSYRKPLLLTFAAIGAFSASLFLPLSSTSPLWMVSALFAILANVGFGASVVAMNAYLPSLAKDSPEVVQAYSEMTSSLENRDENSALTASIDLDLEPSFEEVSDPLLGRPIHPSTSQSTYTAALSRATSRISSLGIASGYGAGIILLLVALIPVTRLDGSTFSLRLAIGLSGIWWALFSIPAAIWLPNASNVDEPESSSIKPDDDWTFSSEIAVAWKRLGVMLRWREIKRLQNTFRYLAAWFLLSDGFTTITSTAILFGKTTLHMQASSLVLIGAITPLSGIIGSLVSPILQRKFMWSNLHVLVLLVMMVSLIPAYGCLGFLPVFKGTARFGGLTTQGEMFGLAVYFGFAYGAFQSYARALYAELLPPGEEARWYGLFSITDKSSSFVGPLIVGLIADTTGNIRYAFFFLVFMVWAAVPVLLSVNVDQGRQDAKDYVSRRILVGE
ncbi:autophagy-related protein 22-like protein [Suillus bovinus]|uniref:autophagy-related protein 22-like protein n=1 Tax=Suillus bovinus TaxID=48563 RepID=UPI001B865D28|nr:autophagy-related protein 22-like protein [Suillus bovinus]KAG2144452.1 autophagy-related protein 22-like protein [Suillus bovinus]